MRGSVAKNEQTRLPTHILKQAATKRLLNCELVKERENNRKAEMGENKVNMCKEEEKREREKKPKQELKGGFN